MATRRETVAFLRRCCCVLLVVCTAKLLQTTCPGCEGGQCAAVQAIDTPWLHIEVPQVTSKGATLLRPACLAAKARPSLCHPDTAL